MRRRVLGLDPGLQATGWGVVSCEGSQLRYEDSGTVAPRKDGALELRLLHLYDELTRVLASARADTIAVEEQFAGVNRHASLQLGHARAVCLLAAAQTGKPIGQYAPARVKQALTGYGRADKDQIRAMLRLLLPQAQPATEHAADALAIAICHAHSASASFSRDRKITAPAARNAPAATKRKRARA